MTGTYRVLQWLVCGWTACAIFVAPSFAEDRHPHATQACAVGVGSMGGVQASTQPDQSQGTIGRLARITSGLAIDGSAVVHAVSGDLEVMKKVWPSGAYAIRLRRDDDTVEIRADRNGVSVNRRGQSLTVVPGITREEELLAVRELLAGSRSVRAMRMLGAALASGAVRSPGALGLALTDAIVGVLDGDVMAVERLAERLGGRSTAVALVSSQGGCYETWESEVIRAWSDYDSCVSAYPTFAPWRDACSLRWVLWAESAWFSFLKCAGSPFIAS
jgi:hypothetical protein